MPAVRSLSGAALIALLFALPLSIGEYRAYQLALYFLYAAAATGVGLCWGRAGFLPLGQAMFFGLSAYLSGFALIAFEDSLWDYLLLPLAALASGLFAWGIGLLVFRRQGESGPYFSMITLALSLLAFQLATSWNSLTGGFNGLKGIPGLPGLDDYAAAYYVSAVVLLIVLALAAWLNAAPLGVLWRAAAEDERRVACFGFNTNALKAVAFAASGLFAGLGGAFYAPQQGLVTPEITGFSLSASFVIWAAVGGRFALLGPTAGTLVIGTLTAELRDRVAFWEALMAVFFILVVLVFPQGLAGPLALLDRRLQRRRRVKPALLVPPRPAQEPARLELDGISAAAGEVRILDRLSLSVDRPAIYCMIGPNGAGKTSTFNLVSGELQGREGRLLLDGRSVAGLSPHRVARLGIARKFQIPTIFTELTIDDNLSIALWSRRAAPLQLLQPRLRRWASPMLEELSRRYPFLASGKRSAAALSHGERQILELAMALLTEPRLLLLDEPCAGLSPEETAGVIEVVRWARDQLGIPVVVIEHDMALVKELAETVYVLHNGALLAQGSVAEIRANPAVQAVYVGGEK